MRNGLSQFAFRLHFRLQRAPREQHEALSEILIRSLELGQLSLDLVGARLYVERPDGRPFRLDAWTQYLRTLMEAPDSDLDVDAFLEAFELNPEALPDTAEVQVQVASYPELAEAVASLVAQGMGLLETALSVIGASVQIDHHGETYSPSGFADAVLRGEIKGEPA